MKTLYVLIVLLGILFVSLLVSQARAEWYLAGDLMQARFQGPQTDGTWVQQGVPSRDGIPAVKQTKEHLAWGVGAGYRFADGERWWAERWSIEGGYRYWGVVSAGGLWVGDHQYFPETQTVAKGAKSSEAEAADHLQGGYLRVAKGFPVGYGIEPFVSAGAFVAYHDLNFWARPKHGRMVSGGFTGIVAGPTVGGGVKYELWRGIKARAGVDAHFAVTESGHAISSQWLTVGGGIEVPLTGW